MNSDSVNSARTLCLGEALVDLICEGPSDCLTTAPSFSPHFGGAGANVAVSASRHGARVALAGGVGADAWGTWLRDRLAREAIDLTWFVSVSERPTPLACVAVDGAGEPSYTIYAEALPFILAALEPAIESAVNSCEALFLGSNTLVGADERRVTELARRTALALGRPVLFDANIRLERWASAAAAVSTIMRVVPCVRLLRANRVEAALLTGTDDVELAAERLLGAGADAVIITLGADGALLRGPARVDVAGVRVTPLSTVGAGDALTGVLVAAMTRHGYDVGCLGAALGDAVAEGAQATQRWGAVDVCR